MLPSITDTASFISELSAGVEQADIIEPRQSRTINTLGVVLLGLLTGCFLVLASFVAVQMLPPTVGPAGSWCLEGGKNLQVCLCLCPCLWYRLCLRCCSTCSCLWQSPAGLALALANCRHRGMTMFDYVCCSSRPVARPPRRTGNRLTSSPIAGSCSSCRQSGTWRTRGTSS